MVSKHISDKEATFSQTATRLGISNAPSGAMLAVFAYSGTVIGSITQNGICYRKEKSKRKTFKTLWQRKR